MAASIVVCAGLLPASASAASASSAQHVAAGHAASPWTIQKTPKPSGSIGSVLSEVACVSAVSCVAVGDYENSEGFPFALAEMWNGTAWTVQKPPSPKGATSSTLSGVSCTSKASTTTCTAVGDYESTSSELTLAEVWNGATWTIEKTANPTGSSGDAFTSVSCVAASNCTAVGSYFRNFTFVLAEVWNGATWAIAKTPTPTVSGESGGVLSSVSCSSASACAAVGNSDVLNTSFSEVWDGSTWTIHSIPNPQEIGDSGLYGVSCVSPTSCTAAGVFINSGFVKTTLAEEWNGTKWKIQSTPNPAQREVSQLLAVSCLPGACTAVGDSSLPEATLAEVWNGSTWKIQTIPNQTNLDDTLTGLSCTSASTCVAVGGSTNGALVEAK